MLKNTLLSVAAAAAIMGGATALQPAPAEAASVYIGFGGKHYGQRHNFRRHCYVTYKRVWVKHGWHRRGHLEWRPVRVCPSHYSRYRRY